MRFKCSNKWFRKLSRFHILFLSLRQKLENHSVGDSDFFFLVVQSRGSIFRSWRLNMFFSADESFVLVLWVDWDSCAGHNRSLREKSDIRRWAPTRQRIPNNVLESETNSDSTPHHHTSLFLKVFHCFVHVWLPHFLSSYNKYPIRTLKTKSTRDKQTFFDSLPLEKVLILCFCSHKIFNSHLADSGKFKRSVQLTRCHLPFSISNVFHLLCSLLKHNFLFFKRLIPRQRTGTQTHSRSESSAAAQDFLCIPFS